MNLRLIEILDIGVTHISKHYSATRKEHHFLCGLLGPEQACIETNWENLYVSTCATCVDIYNGHPVLSRGENKSIDIGTVLNCPIEVAETGFVKVVADQRHCERNPHSSENWDLKVMEYDPQIPDAYKTPFSVTMKEIEEWNGESSS